MSKMASIRTKAACHEASARSLELKQLPNLMRYVNDPQFRADMDAEREVERNKCNAAIDAGLAKYRAERGIV